MRTKLILAGGTLFAAVTIGTVGAVFQGPAPTATESASADPRPANNPSQRPSVPGQTDAPLRRSNVAFNVVTVARELQSPWGLAFLPDRRMLVTEKSGRLRIVSTDGQLSAPVA